MGIVLWFSGSTVGKDNENKKDSEVKVMTADRDNYSVATFAGGCFWCMEPPFERLDGVVEVASGYSGGPEVNPTYQEVASGMTGHAEAVEIVYDPEKITSNSSLECSG